MKLLTGFQHIAQLAVDTAATIGNFDGVHKGHQALIAQLKAQAGHLNLPVLVLVFEPQPAEYFHGIEAPARLASLREKCIAFQALGVDYLACLKFNAHLASMTADDFAESIIFSLIRARYLLLGQDFRFGCQRQGDVPLLQRLGQEKHCSIELFPDFFIENQRVSSTRVRKALNTGDFDQAEQLLGHPFRLHGRVIYGDQRGRRWGIPTANLRLNRKTIPLKGVYCVQVSVGDRQIGCGVANIGYRPTVDGVNCRLEVHVFDFEGSLYGEWLTVDFLSQLREEKRFDDVNALIAQIHQDIVDAKHWFKSNHDRI